MNRKLYLDPNYESFMLDEIYIEYLQEKNDINQQKFDSFECFSKVNAVLTSNFVA